MFFNDYLNFYLKITTTENFNCELDFAYNLKHNPVVGPSEALISCSNPNCVLLFFRLFSILTHF